MTTSMYFLELNKSCNYFCRNKQTIELIDSLFATWSNSDLNYAYTAYCLFI